MYLKKATNKRTGRTYLSCAHGYRDQAGKSRTRTIESFGYLDILEKQYPDPIAYFSQVVKEMEAARIEDEKPVIIKKSRLKKIDKRTVNRKNIGSAALSRIYHELGLNTFIRNRGRTFPHKLNVESASRLLVFERALHPGSKMSAWSRQGVYFDKFEFSRDDIYLFLDFLFSIKEDLKTYLHEQVSALYGRNTDCVFYDVTNYHFECDEPDDLRKKGVAKNHMPKPIVQMGLMIDSDGLPITYELFSGNTNDCTTLLPHLKKAKADLGIKRVVVVADKAMNTSDNIVATLAKGDGYLFSQSVRKATEELKSWVLDDKGYKDVRDDSDTYVAYRVKSRIAGRTIAIERPDEGGVNVEVAPGLNVLVEIPNKSSKRKFKIVERQVARWSEKYARRAKAKRSEAIVKALRYVKNPALLKGMIDKTAAKYVSGITYDSKTGEIIKAKEALFLDEERIAAEEALDGYYVLTTSELKWSDDKVIKTYQGLWKIEDSFRVTKSYLEARPIFVWTKDHIEAHFLICFVTLLILRILELQVNKNRRPEDTHSLHAMIETLRQAEGTNIDDNWWIFDHRDDCLDDIGAALGIDFTREIMSRGEIRKLLGETKKI